MQLNGQSLKLCTSLLISDVVVVDYCWIKNKRKKCFKCVAKYTWAAIYIFAQVKSMCERHWCDCSLFLLWCSLNNLSR